MNFRMLPPADPAKRVVTYRDLDGTSFTFTAEDGRAIDAPEGYVCHLSADGWIIVCPCGRTADRPDESEYQAQMRQPGAMFFDVDLDRFITCDGVGWRDAATGVAV